MERHNFPLTLCTASQSSFPKCNPTVDFPSMEESPNFFVLSNPRARPRKKLVINEISGGESERSVLGKGGSRSRLIAQERQKKKLERRVFFIGDPAHYTERRKKFRNLLHFLGERLKGGDPKKYSTQNRGRKKSTMLFFRLPNPHPRKRKKPQKWYV